MEREQFEKAIAINKELDFSGSTKKTWKNHRSHSEAVLYSITMNIIRRLVLKVSYLVETTSSKNIWKIWMQKSKALKKNLRNYNGMPS